MSDTAGDPPTESPPAASEGVGAGAEVPSKPAAPPAPNKPMSIRDRLAMFDKPGGAAPAPAPRPPPPTGRKPLWKPTPAPSSSDAASPSSDAPAPEKSAFSAADAASSIARPGGSLKDRMAALQGAFSAGQEEKKGPPPKPEGAKPRVWKRPPLPPQPEPTEEDAVSPASPPAAAPKPKPEASPASTPLPASPPPNEDVTSIESMLETTAAQLEQPAGGEEDDEGARRAAIAQRMAKLGGLRLGGPPLPTGRKPQPKKEEEERKEKEDGEAPKEESASQPSEAQPEAALAVPGEEVKPEREEAERTEGTDEVVPAKDEPAPTESATEPTPAAVPAPSSLPVASEPAPVEPSATENFEKAASEALLSPAVEDKPAPTPETEPAPESAPSVDAAAVPPPVPEQVEAQASPEKEEENDKEKEKNVEVPAEEAQEDKEKADLELVPEAPTANDAAAPPTKADPPVLFPTKEEPASESLPPVESERSTDSAASPPPTTSALFPPARTSAPTLSPLSKPTSPAPAPVTSMRAPPLARAARPPRKKRPAVAVVSDVERAAGIELPPTPSAEVPEEEAKELVKCKVEEEEKVAPQLEERPKTVDQGGKDAAAPQPPSLEEDSTAAEKESEPVDVPAEAPIAQPADAGASLAVEEELRQPDAEPKGSDFPIEALSPQLESAAPPSPATPKVDEEESPAVVSQAREETQAQAQDEPESTRTPAEAHPAVQQEQEKKDETAQEGRDTEKAISENKSTDDAPAPPKRSSTLSFADVPRELPSTTSAVVTPAAEPDADAGKVFRPKLVDRTLHAPSATSTAPQSDVSEGEGETDGTEAERRARIKEHTARISGAESLPNPAVLRAKATTLDSPASTPSPTSTPESDLIPQTSTSGPPSSSAGNEADVSSSSTASPAPAPALQVDLGPKKLALDEPVPKQREEESKASDEEVPVTQDTSADADESRTVTSSDDTASSRPAPAARESGESAQDEQEKTEEERRARIATRMAKLGGIKFGAPPFFPPQPTKSAPAKAEPAPEPEPTRSVPPIDTAVVQQPAPTEASAELKESPAVPATPSSTGTSSVIPVTPWSIAESIRIEDERPTSRSPTVRNIVADPEFDHQKEQELRERSASQQESVASPTTPLAKEIVPSPADEKVASHLAEQEPTVAPEEAPVKAVESDCALEEPQDAAEFARPDSERRAEVAQPQEPAQPSSGESSEKQTEPERSGAVAQADPTEPLGDEPVHPPPAEEPFDEPSEEQAEAVRRAAIAERLSKQGGLRIGGFGPMPPAPPPRTVPAPFKVPPSEPPPAPATREEPAPADDSALSDAGPAEEQPAKSEEKDAPSKRASLPPCRAPPVPLEQAHGSSHEEEPQQGDATDIPLDDEQPAAVAEPETSPAPEQSSTVEHVDPSGAKDSTEPVGDEPVEAPAEEEDDAARRARIAERLRKQGGVSMGGFRPIPPVPAFRPSRPSPRALRDVGEGRAREEYPVQSLPAGSSSPIEHDDPKAFAPPPLPHTSRNPGASQASPAAEESVTPIEEIEHGQLAEEHVAHDDVEPAEEIVAPQSPPSKSDVVAEEAPPPPPRPSSHPPPPRHAAPPPPPPPASAIRDENSDEDIEAVHGASVESESEASPLSPSTGQAPPARSVPLAPASGRPEQVEQAEHEEENDEPEAPPPPPRPTSRPPPPRAVPPPPAPAELAKEPEPSLPADEKEAEEEPQSPAPSTAASAPLREEQEENDEEAVERTRKQTIAERMARLAGAGGFRFGPPPPLPGKKPPPLPDTREVTETENETETDVQGGAGEETVSPPAAKGARTEGDSSEERKAAEEPPAEETDAERRARITARLAAQGGLRSVFGGPPAAPAPPKAAPPPPPPPAAEESDEPEDTTEDAPPPPPPPRPASHPPPPRRAAPPPSGAEPAEVHPAPPSRTAPPPASEEHDEEEPGRASLDSPAPAAPARPPVPRVPQGPPPRAPAHFPPPPPAAPAHGPPPPPPASEPTVAPPSETSEGNESFEVISPHQVVDYTPESPSPSAASPKPARAAPPLDRASLDKPTPAPPTAGAPGATSSSSPRAWSHEQLLHLSNTLGLKVVEMTKAQHEMSRTMPIADGTALGFVVETLAMVNAVQDPDVFQFGQLVFSQIGASVNKRLDDPRPGDVIVLIGAEFKGRKGLGSYKAQFGMGTPHAAFITECDIKKGKMSGLQATAQANKYPTLETASWRLADLKSGDVKVFRPVPI